MDSDIYQNDRFLDLKSCQFQFQLVFEKWIVNDEFYIDSLRAWSWYEIDNFRNILFSIVFLYKSYWTRYGLRLAESTVLSLPLIYILAARPP